MKTILQLFMLMLIYSGNILAQEEETKEETKSTFDISGSLDVYYRSNLVGDYYLAPGTSFANLPGFSLGMANLVVAKEGDKVGFSADLVFGPRGEDATFLSPILRPCGSSSIINQLYAYWNITEGITATLGNFNTFLGYEVISPTGNFNYSTSYMFSYGPFSHSGLKLDFDLGNGFSLMTGVFNPTDETEYNSKDKYAAGFQLGYESGGLGLWLNSIISDDFYQLDLTAGYEITDALYLGLNATKAKDSFTGSAIYLQYATSEKLKLGTRIEYFKDEGVGVDHIGNGESVIDFTVSAQYTIGELTLIPEIRLDQYSAEDVIVSGTDSGSTLSSVVLAALYAF